MVFRTNLVDLGNTYIEQCISFRHMQTVSLFRTCYHFPGYKLYLMRNVFISFFFLSVCGFVHTFEAF